MGIVAQHNPMRAKIVLNLAARKMTVEIAAKVAQVPISGVLGWMKLTITAVTGHPQALTRMPPKASRCIPDLRGRGRDRTHADRVSFCYSVLH
jgi:hypothetical protein